MRTATAFAPFLALVAWLCVGVSGASAQACSASFSPVAFGANINILSGAAIDSAGSLTISCAGFGVGQAKQALVCVGLGNGLNSTAAPRYMTSGTNRLAYDLYTDAGRTQRWDATAATEPSFILNASTPSVTVPVYGRIVALQKTSPAGFYLDVATPGVYMAHFNGQPPTCPSATTPVLSAAFQVSANITANCGVTATNMTFPASNMFKSATDAQSSVFVTCTTNAPYWVALDGGRTGAANPAARKMTLGAASITYGLYRDAARAQLWGSSQYVNTVAGTGSASANAIPVYGRIPAQTAPPAGTYTDLVTVTVNF